jgi:hypothetical protein
MPVHGIKVAVLPLHLPCSGLLTHSGENSYYWPVSHEEETGRITANSSRDEMYEKNSRITWTDYKTNTEIAKELNVTPV